MSEAEREASVDEADVMVKEDEDEAKQDEEEETAAAADDEDVKDNWEDEDDENVKENWWDASSDEQPEEGSFLVCIAPTVAMHALMLCGLCVGF